MIPLPRVQHPRVSVVMVTYGGGDWPLRALEALSAGTEPVFEVIVIDNASPDGAGERVRDEAPGASVVLNETNTGFGPASNQGAALATAPYVCFLNPDALVQDGWLPPLLETLERDPRAVAVVPTLLNMDGTLQEAGSLVGADGETWAYGQDEDPSDPSFRFRRYVDYGSAACMVVERAAFEAVGGFDPGYQPAYCEDVDLCLSLAERGGRTVYEPRSLVRHGRAASTDPVRAQAMIVRNRGRLIGKWHRVLATRPLLADAPLYPHRVVHARDALCLDRLLVVRERVMRDDPLLRVLVGGIPDGRITLAAIGGGDPGPWPDLGVEVVLGPRDWGTWLARRPFHASVVIAPPGTPLEEPLAVTQPGAARLSPGDISVDDLPAVLARGGVILSRQG